MIFLFSRNSPEIENLFGELIQDESTAASAYNALICGTAKYMKVNSFKFIIKNFFSNK